MLLRSVYYILPVTWTHRGNLARLGTLTSFCVAGYNDLVCVDGYNDLVLRGWLPWLGLAWMVTMTWFCVVVVTSNWVCVAGDPDWFCVAGYNDLVLCGLLPWLRFAWMVTMTWFCVAWDPDLDLRGWLPWHGFCPSGFSDLVLSGQLPWYGFAWMVVAKNHTFPVFSQPRNNPGRIRWTKFFRDGLQSSHLCRMHTPVPSNQILLRVWSKLKFWCFYDRNQNKNFPTIEKIFEFDLFALYYPKPVLAVQTAFSIGSHQVCSKPRIV